MRNGDLQVGLVRDMRKVPLVNLGTSGLKVSKLGFGTFDFGVPSLNISPEEGAHVLEEAHKLGVSFWDTSDDYGSHPHVAAALRIVPRKDVVISTKTSAKTGKDAKKSLQTSLTELAIDYVDLFLLHFVKSGQIRNCRLILRELADMKAAGVVRAIGLSTHSVAVVREASRFEDLDIIMTICCNADQTVIKKFHEEIPLEDGSIEEMFDAVKQARENGKGTIAIKVLGSSAPPLVEDYQSSIEFIDRSPFVDAMLVGMRNLDQVRKNVRAILSG
jgi:aryl-alcohol dehydrogenase-like predicted oxidoreductase